MLLVIVINPLNRSASSHTIVYRIKSKIITHRLPKQSFYVIASDPVILSKLMFPSFNFGWTDLNEIDNNFN